MSYCYLLHFEPSYKHARHYLGFSSRDPYARLAEHRAGSGARLTQVAAQAGVHFLMARIWPGGTRTLERKLKNRGGAARICPICKAQEREGRKA